MRNGIINSMAAARASGDRAPVRGGFGMPGGQTSLAGAFLQNRMFEADQDDARPSRRGGAPTRKDGSEVGIVADIAIRAIGLAALALSVAIFRWVYFNIHHHPAAEASIGQLAPIAVAFLSASIGCGLLVLGRHIYDRIELGERWRPRL